MTHKRQEVSYNWKLSLCIQVTYLRQWYFIFLTQISTDSALQTHPHTHTHTYFHLQVNSLSELTLPDTVIIQKFSRNHPQIIKNFGKRSHCGFKHFKDTFLNTKLFFWVLSSVKHTLKHCRLTPCATAGNQLNNLRTSDNIYRRIIFHFYNKLILPGPVSHHVPGKTWWVWLIGINSIQNSPNNIFSEKRKNDWGMGGCLILKYNDNLLS